MVLFTDVVIYEEVQDGQSGYTKEQLENLEMFGLDIEEEQVTEGEYIQKIVPAVIDFNRNIAFYEHQGITHVDTLMQSPRQLACSIKKIKDLYLKEGKNND